MRPTTSEDVLDCVRRYPGIHLRGIERELGMSSPLVHYHVRQLEARGRVLSAPYGGYTRYFPTEETPGLDAEEREILAALREEVPLHVALLLLERGPMPQSALAEGLDLAKSTVSYHVEKLVQRGLVRRVDTDGGGVLVALDRPKRMRDLLRRYEPTAELLDRFRGLWEDFYGR